MLEQGAWRSGPCLQKHATYLLHLHCLLLVAPASGSLPLAAVCTGHLPGLMRWHSSGHAPAHQALPAKAGLNAGTASKQGDKKSKKRRLQAETAALAQSSSVPAGQVHARDLARQEAAMRLLASLIRVRPCVQLWHQVRGAVSGLEYLQSLQGCQ